jgi:hypothetical protein
MSHENAPATKLLATNCACCGRALVDALSVETGIGPECRKRFAVDVVTDDAARQIANVLIHTVARKGVSKTECRMICGELVKLGFEVLAARILKRFRTTLPTVVTLTPAELEAARIAYRTILNDFTYDNVDAKTLTAAVKNAGASTPSECIATLEALTCPCRRCAGTGQYITGSTNGQPTGPGGICFRCEGKGRQNLADARRNRAFDALNVNRYARAS